MLTSKTIRAALPNVLKTIDLEGLGEKQQGKVRDYYVLPSKRVIVTTDRQSAFDVILGQIPFKGAILNQLAAWWFERTKHIIPNHVISVPHPNVLIAHNCEPLKVEMVVRGYLSGVTGTSIWTAYKRGERNIYGLKFPEGMKYNQKLAKPVITPTSHGGGKDGHDQKLTREEIIKDGLVDKKIYQQMEEKALELFAFGTKVCKESDLLLVDSKYEFGLYNGKLMLMDEVHTPDSSRYWKADTYKQRFEAGEEPEGFDKQFLRLWYAERGFTGDGTPPVMTEELIVGLAQRYCSAYEIITGKQFKPYRYPIQHAIEAAVAQEPIKDFMPATL